MQRMKEPHKKGVATHLDPESCGCFREEASEALTGARIGRVLSLENCKSECRRRSTVGRQYHAHRKREVGWAPRGLRPRACTEAYVGTWEISWSSCGSDGPRSARESPRT